MEELERRRSVVFVLGLPGSGKGTICRRIAQKYGFEHVSVGEVFRRETATEGSTYGPVFRLLGGKHVPPEIKLELLKNVLAKIKSDTFLLDGFPRNLELLKAWDADMADKFPLKFVLFLDCPNEICRMRIARRAEQGSGRPDDYSVSFLERQRLFETTTMKVIDHFYGTKDIVRVDASASNPDAARAASWYARTSSCPPDLQVLCGWLVPSPGHSRRLCRVLCSEWWQQVRHFKECLRLACSRGRNQHQASRLLAGWSRTTAQATEFLWKQVFQDVDRVFQAYFGPSCS